MCYSDVNIRFIRVTRDGNWSNPRFGTIFDFIKFGKAVFYNGVELNLEKDDGFVKMLNLLPYLQI